MFPAQQHLLDAFDHPCRGGPMLAATCVQVDVRCRDAQLVEEHLAHVGIVVLAGVQQGLLELPLVRTTHGSAQGGGLDDLRTSADDGEEAERSVHDQ